MVKASKAGPSTIDAGEVARFNALAAQWWDPAGPMRPLHAMTPARMTFVRDALCDRFDRNANSRRSLEGLRILDIGCGAGLASEPLARLGADVTGMDAAPDAIAAARLHAEAAGLVIDYRVGGPEDLPARTAKFDAIVALEVLEHVADVPAFLATCRRWLKPGGLLVYSTLNRSAASFATAIIGAEHIVRLVPRGTHDWRKFLKPQEIEDALGHAGFTPGDQRGLAPDPLKGGWRLTRRMPVNYIGVAHAA